MGGRASWGWIPGRRYAPAWVTWRTGYDGYGYVGWAPLAPSYYWHGGRAYGLGFYPTHAYAFAPTGALFHPGLAGHLVTGPQVGVVAGNTRAYVPANPGVGHAVGHAPTSPSPGSLGIPAHAVVAPPAGHAGLTHAQAFGRPSTAVAMGGHSPGYAHNGSSAPSHQGALRARAARWDRRETHSVRRPVPHGPYGQQRP